MTIMNLAGRVIGMVVGILGAIVAFLVTFINFFVKNIRAGGLGNAHTPTGLLMSILALVGAVIAIPYPLVSAVLMLIAGMVMIFVAGGLGVLPLVLLAIAAILVFLDRNRARTARVS